jgi:glycine betaine/proline transport system substrate-binding protein
MERQHLLGKGYLMIKQAMVIVSALVLSTGGAYADSESCKTVRFADVGWTDIQVTTSSAVIVLEALGYKAEVTTISVPVALASMKNNDIDVFLGNWMPSMTLEMAPYNAEKSIDTVGLNLEGAGYGLVVPQYVADAGVKSLADIGAHKDKFKGKIYGIDPGDEGNRIITEMIADPKNNLAGFELIESSEAGMLTEAEKAMAKNEWIIFLAWTPHPIMAGMKIHYLDGMGESGFGSAKVYTLSRAGYTKDCPNAGRLVSNLKFDLAMESAMMEPVLTNGVEPKASALAWLKANPDAIKPWLNGVTTLDGGDAAAAVSAALAK